MNSTDHPTVPTRHDRAEAGPHRGHCLRVRALSVRPRCDVYGVQVCRSRLHGRPERGDQLQRHVAVHQDDHRLSAVHGHAGRVDGRLEAIKVKHVNRVDDDDDHGYIIVA